MNEWNESNLVNYYYKRTHMALGITCTLNTYAQGHSHILLLFTEKKNASCPLNALSKMDYPSLFFFSFLLCRIPQESSIVVSFRDREFFVSQTLLASTHEFASSVFYIDLHLLPPPFPAPPGNTRWSHAYSWEGVEREWSVAAAPGRNVMGRGVWKSLALYQGRRYLTRVRERCSLLQAYF